MLLSLNEKIDNWAFKKGVNMIIVRFPCPSFSQTQIPIDLLLLHFKISPAWSETSPEQCTRGYFWREFWCEMKYYYFQTQCQFFWPPYLASILVFQRRVIYSLVGRLENSLVRFPKSCNSWIKIRTSHFLWSNLYFRAGWLARSEMNSLVLLTWRAAE